MQTDELFQHVTTLPTSAAFRPVRMYLAAQANKDFGAAAEFFADDVQFHGLVLQAGGRARVAGEMEGFIRAAIERVEIEAIAEVESGANSRFLALYRFKTRSSAEPQTICDHITVADGRIVRIENVFDVRRLMPG